MHLFGSKSWRRRVLALTTALSCLLLTAAALAAGTIQWGNKTLKPRSDNVSWNVEIAIFLPKPPDVPSVPVKFIFQQTVYYERSIVDGDKHITRNVPIVGKQPIVESVDVGFLDPRSGKIEKRTKFTFKLHRDHGYESGEYKVTVRDARNDSIIGQPTTIIFGGENEEIDRRSIVFSGEKKKEKKEEKKPDSEAAPGATDGEKPADANEDSDPGRNKAGKPESALETPPEESAPAPMDDAEVKKKPGGCGCSVPGENPASAPWGLFIAAAALLAARRKPLRA